VIQSSVIMIAHAPLSRVHSTQAHTHDARTFEPGHVHNERQVLVLVVPPHRAEVARARLPQHLRTPGPPHHTSISATTQQGMSSSTPPTPPPPPPPPPRHDARLSPLQNRSISHPSHPTLRLYPTIMSSSGGGTWCVTRMISCQHQGGRRRGEALRTLA
jgi:hypothetical protein